MKSLSRSIFQKNLFREFINSPSIPIVLVNKDPSTHLLQETTDEKLITV